MLSGKKVLLGVTGSIAAYKSTYLVRLLIKAGAEVKVVLSPAARDFVTPLSLSTLSKNPVLWEYFDPSDDEGKWNNHVDLALWADLLIIAPATANTLSKMVGGGADNLLMGIYLSAKCPVYFAPAMDLDMYKHQSTRQNIEQLQSFGNRFIPSGEGELASGLEGEGRMADPEEIIRFIEADLKKGLPLRGKKVLINAGPTHELIDPVRYLGNHSTGKMGIALADKAYFLGAEVVLVLGATNLRPENKSIRLLNATTALEMEKVCKEEFPKADIAVFSAAIADYRPEESLGKKIKKSGENLSLTLVENPDILYNRGQEKRDGQILVGFALETDNAVANAIKKLHKKNCDLIVVNTPGDKSGFGSDTNEVILLDRHEQQTKIELKSKAEIAEEILHHIIEHILPR